MPLSVGDKLGPYEVLSSIGAGGMGEVYRARDSRLGRDVALKILPPDMARDLSRRQRFELEARAVAALNHPNIVALYDVGEGYIVNELVDGEPLSGVKLGLRQEQALVEAPVVLFVIEGGRLGAGTIQANIEDKLL